MSAAPNKVPIIETEVFGRLKWVFEAAATTAELYIVKGPVGIGKSFAVAHTVPYLEAQGVKVVRVTSSPEVEGSILGFASAVLRQFHIYEGAGKHAVEALTMLLDGRPFGTPPSPVLFIVDEAQGLKLNVLEMLRGLWDDGDRARNGAKEAPAFGLVLCGNETFLNRASRPKAVEYRPLMSRALDVNLPAPREAECRTFAEKLAVNDPAAIPSLAAFGAEQGNFRAVEKAYRQACHLAGDRALSAEDVQKAIFLIRGRK